MSSLAGRGLEAGQELGPRQEMDGHRAALLGWRSARERGANGLHCCAPDPPSSGGDAHGREAGTSVLGLIGHVNGHSVFLLGVMVEGIASAAGLQGTAYAWDSGPDVCATGGFIRLWRGRARSWLGMGCPHHVGDSFNRRAVLDELRNHHATAAVASLARRACRPPRHTGRRPVLG
jgi:hypothetical protein